VTRRRLVLGLALALVVVLALNVVGLLRYPGGPLKEFPDGSLLSLDIPLGGDTRNQVGVTSAAGLTRYEPVCEGVYLRTGLGLPVTIEDMRLVDPTSGITLVDSVMVTPDAATGGVIGVAYGPACISIDGHSSLPETLAAESQPRDGLALVVSMATSPGRQSYSGIAIDYRVGPFSFTTVYGPAMAVCVSPLPQGATCSPDEAP
jgi:hypothetical protein